MYRWMNDLFLLCRSLTGSGVDPTLKYIEKQIKINLKLLILKVVKSL